MPPKAKQHAHQRQPQPPPQPSDYETDAPAPAAVDVAPPPQRSNEELNLTVLRRRYPGVVSIRHVTPYAVLYTFDLDSQQWEKVGIEGTLFFCELERSHIGADRFSVIILNRRGLDNFDMEIISDEEVDITGEFIIVAQSDQIYGIWVFSEPPPSSTANARTDAAEKIIELAKQAKESREARERTMHNGVKLAEQAEESVPMGRQLSLRELFGQQREQDAAFSVHNHSHGQNAWAKPEPAQNDVLGQLFRKAKQDYNGVG